MKRSLSHFLGHKVQAVDGDIGRVWDFYFDDQAWAVRYLVVSTTGWWPGGRHVLIAPAAFIIPMDWHADFFPLRLTRSEVRHAPEIDLEKPVERDQEERLAAHYNWPAYWNSPLQGEWTGPASASWPVMDEAQRKAMETNETAEPTARAYPLRSFREIRNYHIQTVEGDSGKLKDLLVDDQDWMIGWLVVETGMILPGKEILLAPHWISQINWPDASIVIEKLHAQDLEGSPVYDPRLPLTPENEERYYRYFHKPE